jgi:hypothetical protein
VVRPRRRCQFYGGACRRRHPSEAVLSWKDLIAFSIIFLGSFL